MLAGCNEHADDRFRDWGFARTSEREGADRDHRNIKPHAAAAHDLFVAFLSELVPKIPGGLEPGKEVQAVIKASDVIIATE